MKKIFLFNFFIFTYFLKAQFLIGVKSGLSFGLINTIPKNRGFIFDQTWPGFAFSLIGEYRFLEKFGLQLGASWTQKNIHINRKPYIIYDFNNYLETPLMFKYFFLEKNLFKPFLALGGYIGYWAWSYERGMIKVIMESDKYPYYLYSGKFIFEPKRDQRWDLGFLGSLGVEYQISRHHVFLENQFSYGLKNTRKKRPFKLFRGNMAFIFYLGYIYEL